MATGYDYDIVKKKPMPTLVKHETESYKNWYTQIYSIKIIKKCINRYQIGIELQKVGLVEEHSSYIYPPENIYNLT